MPKSKETETTAEVTTEVEPEVTAEEAARKALVDAVCSSPMVMCSPSEKPGYVKWNVRLGMGDRRTSLWVAVGGRGYHIPVDQVVELPANVVAAFIDAETQREIAEGYITEATSTSVCYASN